MIYQAIVNISWILVGAYWFLLSFKNKESEKSEPSFSRIAYLILMVFSFCLLFSKSFFAKFWLNNNIHNTPTFYPLGFVIALAGLAFAVYSRYYLGKNWSGRVEIKEDHQLLTAGPYSITRNPIYTGLLFGILGTALIHNQLKGLLALVLVFCVFLIKIKKEEIFLLKKFPEYEIYIKKVKKIIPFVY